MVVRLYVSLLVFGAVFFLSLFFLLNRAPDKTLKERLGEKEEKKGFLDFLTKIFLPLNQHLLKPLLLKKEKLQAKLQGAKAGISFWQFISLKEFFLISIPWGVFLLFNLKEPLILIVIAIMSFFLPDIWLNSRLKARQNEILKTLPDVVDLLNLCVGAGLDFNLAVNWIIKKYPTNPLIEELSLMMQETRIGKPRREALKDMAKRINLADIYSFSRALIQAERMGTPVAEALSMLSDEVRQRRFQRGERQALKAPIKMLLPLIFFILPVVAIIVGGPIILQFVKAKPFALMPAAR